MKRSFSVLSFALAFASACSRAPEPTTVPAPQRSVSQGGDTTARAGGDSARGGGAAQPRPYNRVITRDARTRRGMFVVHRVNDKLYFEIPLKELNKDMLLVGRLTRAAAANPRLPGGQFGSYGGDQFADASGRKISSDHEDVGKSGDE